jgi:4-hydroxy-3-methylbut-2-enyl diphosphate reductase IspH
VVGGRSSNNTRELVQTCARYCDCVHHVETDADVQSEWFGAAQVVGLTAGTSTPDEVIDRVEARIRLCAEGSVRRRPLDAIEDEDVHRSGGRSQSQSELLLHRNENRQT